MTYDFVNPSKNIERWFEGIFPSDSTKSNGRASTGMADGVDKPLSCQTKATLKQEVNAKTTYVQLSLDLGSFGSV
ncbi:MAG: hypothetical protein SWX82_34840 [Cyanobacteriota bacterium]|nr:hypothetical protein [Cyanobacteriota bacterium]